MVRVAAGAGGLPLGVEVSLLEVGVGAAGAMLAALVGAMVGGWLTRLSAEASAKATARHTAQHSLARLYVLLWPPTRHVEFLAGVEALDADLVVAGVSPELRAALVRVATECWQDAAGDGAAPPGQEPAIATRLLGAYRRVRDAILVELGSGGRRDRVRARAVLDHVEEVVTESARDRESRPAAGSPAPVAGPQPLTGIRE